MDKWFITRTVYNGCNCLNMMWLKLIHGSKKVPWYNQESSAEGLDIDCVVQDSGNSLANTLGLLQSCTKPSIFYVLYCTFFSITLQRRHNERDDVTNLRRLHCLLNCCFRRRSKKMSKLRVTGLARNSPVTGEFPAQRVSNVENVSISWRHHESAANEYGVLSYSATKIDAI